MLIVSLVSVLVSFMAINVVSEFLPDIILLTLLCCCYHRGTRRPFKCHEEVLSLQPMIPPKRFDIFPPVWGMRRGFRCVQIFFLKIISIMINRVRLPILLVVS